MVNCSLLRSGVAVFCLAVLVPSLAFGQASERKPWADVAPPTLLSFGPKAGDPTRLVIAFTLVTAVDGADKAVVDLLGAGDAVVESRTLGKSKNDTKTVEFALTRSGVFRVRVSASRSGLADPKVLTTEAYLFSLPLAPPQVRARNLGRGSVLVSWTAVDEATEYGLRWTDQATGQTESQALNPLSATLDGLAVGHTYDLVVTARRGDDIAVSSVVAKPITAEAERVWSFAQFGQSSNANVNRFELLDPKNLRFKLFSATTLPTGQIDAKGGKFTTFHDGVSFYYTVVDPKTENFELTATFTVDFINPVPDGQEGFGLLVMDSLGADGVSSVNHYTNSAGILATKFEATVDGVKKTSKDTLGVRFVTGITPEVLAQGDSGIAQNGLNVSKAFSYETSDLIQKGGVYTLTLKKTNTGYHVLTKSSVPGEAPLEVILFGADKLAKLDADHDYVGFAAARGCNVTVSDVKWSVSSPQTDAPAQEEPPLLVPLAYKVDSPTATGSSPYPFVFHANADGRLTVTQRDTGSVLVDRAAFKAGEDFRQVFPLATGQNDFVVKFDLDPSYAPAPRTKMGVPGGGQTLKPAEGAFELVHTVYHRTFEGSTIFVGPHASTLGAGTRERPVALALAVAFVQPGQTIELAEGTYFLKNALVIERGNDGTQALPKTLRAAPGERPVLDFGLASGGLVAWGHWWILAGFDVTNTPGNVKGVQVGGNHNLVRDVQTYLCGDTGLQISGSGTESPRQWPADNLILNCTSWGNNDPAQNNADGFAAKLTCGPGNVFRGCLSYNNIDDGWDLFSKIESGPIGAVLIDSCVAWGNGRLPDGSGNGDGNGFKLGGDGIAVPHVLRNSVSFDNGAAGITSNSDPSVILEGNTSFGNRGVNITLYGKGNGSRLFQARGNLSFGGASPDVYREMPELASATNYFWNGAQSLNSEGRAATVDWFVHTDVKVVPSRRTDGSMDLRGLLVLTEKAPQGVGADLH